MKVLYLFGGIRGPLIEKHERGEDPGGGTWGLVHLRKLGVVANLVELEQWFKPKTATYLRQKVLGVYNAHLPFFFNFFFYDIIFTAGAFGTQFVFTVVAAVFGIRRPKWVMHDFSIIGFLNKTKGRKHKLFNYIVARAGGIVTVGKWETEELKRRFPHLADRIEYVPFGVDTNFFQPQNIPEERLIIAVGVDPDRDWKAFFEACEGLDAKILVAGKQRGGVEALRPPANVEIKFFEPKDMVGLYARASAVVIPLDTRSGVNDAMGCSTLYEAMAMGRPMVVSRTHHMESYITNGENGLLVPQQDAKAMREAIDKLLADEVLRKKLGTNARAYALEHLEIMKCTQKLKSFFERLSA